VTVVLDDHLLIARLDATADLAIDDEAATTNLFLVRLMRSALRHSGRGTLLGTWPASRLEAARPDLLELRRSTTIVPMADLAWDIGRMVERHALSTLGAECIAAARHLGAAIWVWERNDGPRIRAAASAEGIAYRTVRL
jgi:hypothetical protein